MMEGTVAGSSPTTVADPAWPAVHERAAGRRARLRGSAQARLDLDRGFG